MKSPKFSFSGWEILTFVKGRKKTVVPEEKLIDALKKEMKNL